MKPQKGSWVHKGIKDKTQAEDGPPQKYLESGLDLASKSSTYATMLFFASAGQYRPVRAALKDIRAISGLLLGFLQSFEA